MQTKEKRRTLTLYNPAAGMGKGPKDAANYFTKCKGDGRRYVKEECLADPDTHFVVCGGDGTANEAVCGIMDAGAGHRATLTIYPCGSGNDTVKSFPTDQKGKTVKLDVIKLNNRFGINMLNIGFDCNVVTSAAYFKQKWKLGGALSYIMGVVREFFRPIGEDFKIDAVLEDGSLFSYHGPTLLCAVCNGQWCGGSFHNSPFSDMQDGVLELLLVKKTDRLNFLKLVGKYQDGSLFRKDGKTVNKKFSDIAAFYRIRSVKVTGMKQVCTDGEVEEMTEANISVLPAAIGYTYG
jgi:diacylglycerol kinase family enzyme